jgi:predicted nucleic acid-binding protein
LSVYADTSFLVAIYLPEEKSSEAQRWLGSETGLWLTPLHLAEWTHAIEQQVFRKQLPLDEALGLHRAFKEHRESGVWQEVALPESAYVRCVELALRHCSRLGLRTLDTLHVASALELRASAFWTFDNRQAALAKAEGLTTRSIRSSTN